MLDDINVDSGSRAGRVHGYRGHEEEREQQEDLTRTVTAGDLALMAGDGHGFGREKGRRKRRGVFVVMMGEHS